MRVVNPSDITAKNYNQTSINRAKTLRVKKDYDTGRHTSFVVSDEATGRKHTVIFKTEIPPPLDWSCDCEWYASKTLYSGKYCAHILAVNLLLNKENEK